MLMPEEFTNRELGILINQNHDATKETLVRIEGKVDHTNGDVRALKLWRTFLAGVSATIVFLIPIMYLLMQHTLNSFNKDIDYKIQTEVRTQTSEAMNIYDKEHFQQ